MKKLLISALSLLLTLTFAMPAFAADADLARAGASDMEAFAQEIEGGRHLFDTAGVLSSEEQAQVEENLREIEEQSGQSAVIVIVENNEISEDLEQYADHLYYRGGLGTGEDRDGVLLVMDLGDDAHRGVQIYAQGGAMRFFTDRAIDQIFDSYDGGILELLQEGRWYAALDRYTGAVEALYRQGVREDQANFDPVTGKTDYYYKKERSVKLWHVIVSLLATGLAGLIPVLSIRSKYAMKAEKRRAQSLNVAYRATSSFIFATANDTMIGQHVVHIPIPRHDDDHHTGGSGFGGGMSTMRSSGGGGFHTSGGRKF